MPGKKNTFFYPSHPMLDDMVYEFFGNTFGNTKAVSKYPLTDIYTVGGVAYFEIAVSGFTKDEIKVELSNDSLRIIGQKKDEIIDTNRVYIKKDIAKRHFDVSYNLMFAIDHIDASINDGILTVVVTPTEKTKDVKQIEIK